MGAYFVTSLGPILSSMKKSLRTALLLVAVVIILTFIVIVFSSHSASTETEIAKWDFTEGSFEGWRVKRAGSASLTSAGLILAGERHGGVKLVSPPIAGGMGVEATGKSLRFKIASEEDGYAILRIKGRTSVKMETFHLRGGAKVESYLFNPATILPSGESIDALSLDLLTGEAPVTLQSISVFRPNGLGRLFASLSSFWRMDTTTTKMINYIEGPRIMGVSFLVAGYILTGLLFVILLIIFVLLKKRTGKRDKANGSTSAVFRAFLVAFAISAFIFTLRMEYRWASLYAQDKAVLSGDESSTRIFTLFSQELPGFLRFLDYIKATVPEGETVRAASDSLGDYLRLARYRLLPLRSSEGANYIWSYNAPSVRFNPSTKRLTDGARVVAEDVEMVGSFGKKGTLYRVTGESAVSSSSFLPGDVTPKGAIAEYVVKPEETRGA